MKKIYIIFFVFTCLAGFMLLYTSLSGTSEKMQVGSDIKNLDLISKAKDIQTEAPVKPEIDFFRLPLYFIANKGQVNEKAKFYAKTSRYTLWLTKEGLVFDSTRTQSAKRIAQSECLKALSAKSKAHSPEIIEKASGLRFAPDAMRYAIPHAVERDVSRLMFVGANKNPEIVPIKEAKLKVNYFIGNDKSKWHCDVPTTLAVLYKNLYKNIDLKVYGIEKQIEYDWIIKPGGNPSDIRFEYKNVIGTHINKKGNLVICTEFGELIHKKPVSYQVEKAGGTEALRQEGNKAKKEMVEVTFKKLGENTFGLVVGEYDKSHELVIDPVVLAYSTYLGDVGGDYGHEIAVDSSGYVYVTGNTFSSDFPTLNPYQPDQRGGDLFVTKIDPNQSGAAGLIYSSYFGGGRDDYGHGIAVDSSGYAYVTGYTKSTDFPTLNPYQGTFQGSRDVFVTKIDPTLSGAASLIYSTYLGGAGNEYGHGIAVDSSGYVYVTGNTGSTDFPTLNPYQTDQGYYDAFVTKIDPTQGGAASLIYSTYLGGRGGEYGHGIAVDGSGYVYVTGYTYSSDFPTLNQYQPDQGGGDVFATKLDPTQGGAASLIYSTYLGGANVEFGYGVAVDSSGYMYVTGETYSARFPTLNQYQAYQGGVDAFITKIDTTQSGIASLIYSTYLGGSDYDYGYGIAVDSRGYVYVTGYTESTDFPTLDPYQADQGEDDVFVTKLDTTHSGADSLIYSTYLGGSNLDRGHGIAVDNSGYVYVTGYTESTDFPTLNPFQTDQGYYDAFVTKIDFYPPLTAPVVTTRRVSSITSTSAVCGGKVTSDGGAAVTHRGVCWNNTGNPTTDDKNTVDGSGIGSYTSYISGLTPDTTYYVRAYAKNSVGKGYGKVREFKTLNNPSISGTITGSSGTGTADVTLTFSNSGGTTKTDQDGCYSHTVERNWSGTVTPSRTGCVFKPAKRTYNTVTSDRIGQDYTAYEIILSLTVSRETEYAWIIRRQYGKINLVVDNPGHITVAKYIIYRKVLGGNYSLLTEIPGSQLQGGTYLYYDKYLDNDKTYTYKFTAVDAAGVTIGVSNEKTI